MALITQRMEGFPIPSNTIPSLVNSRWLPARCSLWCKEVTLKVASESSPPPIKTRRTSQSPVRPGFGTSASLTIFSDIKITFPAPKDSKPTWFPSLKIDLEGHHEVLLLQGESIAFGNLRVRVAEGNIYAGPEWIKFYQGSIVTEKGWIEGLFHSDEYLGVRTCDGRILGGFNSEGTLSMTSEKGDIDVNIISTQQESSAVKFNDISVHAADG
ncbi:hypothetical protein DFP72DRAFT_863408 [Ephemerocybe angulata]|uniref:Uncharacterized protein n=1 Tax=Ephemerocybe angulata TaxID=980116 RepID=A0A8H6H5R7_9AGAR|nr:hypothetical protein DFP72DRAFT_863408 [Tulosesus angulatus]